MRKILIMILAIILTGTVLTLTTPAESHAASLAHATPTVTHTPASKAAREPLMARMVNCEDYDIQPCYTYDDGAWRMVLSYTPYKSVKLNRCKEEDGGPILPCIWKDNNRVKKGQPVTRNVFTKNG